MPTSCAVAISQIAASEEILALSDDHNTCTNVPVKNLFCSCNMRFVARFQEVTPPAERP